MGAAVARIHCNDSVGSNVRSSGIRCCRTGHSLHAIFPAILECLGFAIIQRSQITEHFSNATFFVAIVAALIFSIMMNMIVSPLGKILLAILADCSECILCNSTTRRVGMCSKCDAAPGNALQGSSREDHGSQFRWRGNRCGYGASWLRRLSSGSPATDYLLVRFWLCGSSLRGGQLAPHMLQTSAKWLPSLCECWVAQFFNSLPADLTSWS